MSTFLKKHWFIFALFAAVILGVVLPQAASLNEGGWVTGAIVVLIFLGMGFTLPSEAITTGVSKWKIHLFLQLFIFILTPAVFMLTAFYLRPYFSIEIYIGLLALAVLPTTVSTCAVFTQTSGGDSVLTMFNAALANILGIIVSPLLLSVLLREAGQTMPFEVLLNIITGLALKMVLPLIIGQVLRFFWKQQAMHLKKKIGATSNIFILCIVFFTLAKSASTPVFDQGLSSFIIPVIYLVIIHFVLLFLALGFSILFRFNGAEKISVMYTAPQKTLAMGIPLLSAYFASDPGLLGMAILPLLFYHPWQLFIAGIIKSLPMMERWRDSEAE
ncbi:MAG: bile acid:sodium symporter [Planctomycetes bacterium]|nr:bile acid:sodium symporter [Planctomycetota bacterium]